ncbi:MAG TPA: RecX family transcriptional regulator, partial [Thiobacillaceae bacterium]|nr:RecX family transcriptional regulator [Thiobacillaceae bacterium]
MRTHRDPQLQQTLTAYARELRSLQIDAESRLWHLLRDRRFFGYEFRRQHAVKNFILDFYCAEQHLAIELDGGQHGDRRAHDEKREQTLARLGIRVMRFWNHDLLQQTESVLRLIYDALDMPASPYPQPLAPLAGRGMRIPPSLPLGGGGWGEGDLTQRRGAEGEESNASKEIGGDTRSLRTQALAHLARRDHTRQELARKLLHAGYAETDIDALLDELSQRGWLSDRRFAEGYVEQKRLRFGALKLAHELRSRGVGQADIEQALVNTG